MKNNKFVILSVVFNLLFLVSFSQEVLFKSPVHLYLKKQTKKYLTTVPNNDSALFWAKKGINNSKQGNKNIRIFYSYYACALKKKGIYDSAILYNQKAIELAKKYNNNNGLAVSYFNLANCYREIAKYDSAKLFYLKSFYLNLILKKEKRIITNYNGLAVVLKKEGEYVKAIEIYQKILSLSMENNLDYLQANILNNLGTCFNKLGDTTKSNEYYYQALEIYEKLDYPIETISTLINIAKNISNVNNKKALEKYMEVLEMAQKGDYKKQESIILNNISSIYLSQKNFKSAYKYSLKSYEINKELGRMEGLISSMQNIAINLAYLGRTKEGEKFLNEALEISKQKRITPKVLQVYKSFEKFYFIQKKFSKAYFFRVQHSLLKDSLENQEIIKTINELNIKYETAEKEKEIQTQILVIENKNIQLKNKQQITEIIIIAFIIFAFLSLFLFISFLKQKKAYKILVKQQVTITENELKEKQKTKYKTSQLSDNEKTRLIKDLNKIMIKDEVFTDNSLTIDILSEKLNTNRRYLSQIINEEFNVHFNTFINEYRVKKAKELLLNKSYDTFSIEGIGNTVGFNSRVSFNNAFKKFTGVTPSFFKKNRGITIH